MVRHRSRTLLVVVLMTGLPLGTLGAAEAPRAPSSVQAKDHGWDSGEAVDVIIGLSPDDRLEASPPRVAQYVVRRSGEYGGVYEHPETIVADKWAYRSGTLTLTLEQLEPGEPYFFRVRAVAPDGTESMFVETASQAVVRPASQVFSGKRAWLVLITLIICGSVVGFILIARTGKPLKVRKIAGLEAVDEAVGRATEMGRPCLFVPGILDMNEIQTITGLTILSRVAQVAAEYGAHIEVPTSKSLVMTTASETVESAFLAAGRPDAFNEDDVYYVTDEQFGYVAYLSGMMVREKPAACFYMGAFFAESLILAETGNSIGAIQVAGTAMPSQLPFFVAACDYTLIGEEFFAASAYLSGDPDQLGSLKGQDVGKVIVAGLVIAGCLLATLSSMTSIEFFETATTFLRDTVLKSG